MLPPLFLLGVSTFEACYLLLTGLIGSLSVDQTKPHEPIDSHAGSQRNTSYLVAATLPSNQLSCAFRVICPSVSSADTLFTAFNLYTSYPCSCFEASTTTCTFPLTRTDLVLLSAGTHNHICSKPYSFSRCLQAPRGQIPLRS